MSGQTRVGVRAEDDMARELPSLTLAELRAIVYEMRTEARALEFVADMSDSTEAITLPAIATETVAPFYERLYGEGAPELYGGTG